MVRPEHLMAPEMFYDEREALKYTNCTRIIEVQADMAQRCLELIGVPDLEDEENQNPQLILDIGCGSGLSGEVISSWGH